jgi:disulfide bond formation protein DsbB
LGPVERFCGLVSAFRIGKLRQEVASPQAGESKMNQAIAGRMTWVDRLRTDPAAAAALAICVIGAATILGAWFFEYVLKYPPCELCLEERLPYHIVIPLSLLLTIAALVQAPQKILTVGFVAVLIVVTCGAVLGAYHAGVEWHFWPGPTACTGSLNNLNAGGSILGQLQSINVVMCDQAAWRFLGISLAGYNVLISLAMAAVALYGLLARREAI